MKHVISADIEHDNLTGVCKGQGRIKIRLNEGESEQQIRANFTKAGYMLVEHTENPKKNTKFSGPSKDDGKSSNLIGKDKKAHEMATKF